MDSKIKQLEILALLKYYMGELGLARLFDKFVPNANNMEDFIYVADSKLCAFENLHTIAGNGGHFITVVPRNFREVKGFLERARAGEQIGWQYEHEVPDSRQKGRTQTYRIHVGERLQEDYRILWVHSEAKERLECKNREHRLDQAEQALKKLSSGLNRGTLKTREQAHCESISWHY